MRRVGPGTRAVISIVVGAMLLGVGLVPSALAQTPAVPDGSDVVIVLDFSASILDDAANRNRFGAALERIADRVDATSADLVAGDATVTLVQFATKAADYHGCAELKLLASPATVARFADCLRSVAKDYRDGLDPALTRRIGVDTNYVAAMQQAAKHLPADAVRPALILFSDGKHDVSGVPISQVKVVHDQLFGTRSPIAFLPVGMGLDPHERDALEAGLLRLRVIRDMPACVSGTAFEWPQVVFTSPDAAGNAVAVALQDATCTFTVAPVETPSPTPTAPPTPAPTAAPTPSPTPSPSPSAAVAGPVASPGAGSVGGARTCASAFACNPLLAPILAAVFIVLMSLFVFLLLGLIRDRQRGYVVAVVDVIHTANLGHGSRLGIGFVRDSGSNRVTGIVSERRRKADIRIRHLGGDRFEVKDRMARRIVRPDESIIIADSVGTRHELILRAMAPARATPVSSRR